MSKPIIKATCAAGCLWETVHKSDFDEALPYFRQFAESVPCLQRVDKANNGVAYQYHLECGQYRVFAPIITEAPMGVAMNYFNVEAKVFHEKANGDVFSQDLKFRQYGERGFFDLYFAIDNSEATILVDGETENSYFVSRYSTMEEGDVCYIRFDYNVGVDVYRIMQNTPLGAYLDGINGASVYVRYSENVDGSNFTETWTEGQNYIGIAIAHEEPTDPSAYEWINFKGEDGRDGIDGKSAYDLADERGLTDNKSEEEWIESLNGESVFIRYSASPDGTDFTEERTEGQNYMGVATAKVYAPEDKADYQWIHIFTEVGDIDAALDAILAIQTSLIGGASE